ncbi:histone-lysine N-methyltransferase SETMAR [Trichonephila clavipes]|nr:histone-lysine N-methyltransferase SETMAR [Trichonephila clavipes]
MSKREAPYLILTLRSPVTYEIADLANPDQALVTYHVSALKDYNEPETEINTGFVAPLRKRGRPKRKLPPGSEPRCNGTRRGISCQQLDRLKLEIDQKQPELAKRSGLVFHQDNAWPHTSVGVFQKLWELGWEVLIHPPCIPDLAPSNYRLFLALQNFLDDKTLRSREDFENRLLGFFANNGQDFHERGIMKLPVKWQQIIHQTMHS